MDLSDSGAVDCLTIYMLLLLPIVSLKNYTKNYLVHKIICLHLQPFTIIGMKERFNQKISLAISTVQ